MILFPFNSRTRSGRNGSIICLSSAIRRSHRSDLIVIKKKGDKKNNLSPSKDNSQIGSYFHPPNELILSVPSPTVNFSEAPPTPDFATIDLSVNSALRTRGASPEHTF